MSEPLRVADLVAQTLAAHGISLAFGMPGGEVVTLVDALGEAGIRFVLARQETSAAIMAAGSHASNGAPGLLVTTVGPGLANAVNGIADAAQERVPLIVMSGVVDHVHRARYTHQVFDHTKLLAPLVKASFEIEADGASATVARAIRLAMSHPMGPVHLDLAPGTAALPVNDATVHRPARAYAPALKSTDPGIDAIRAALAGAVKPLVIAGYEAVRAGAGDALTALTAHLSMPIITTYKAKGLVPEWAPQSMGGAGLSPLADGELLRLVKAADVILLAGYDPIEMRTGWLDPFAPQAQVFELSAYLVDHGMHRVDVRVTANVRDAVEALATGLPARKTWTGLEPENARARLADMFAPRASWGPHTVFDALQSALPHNATVTVDSGAHRILLSQQMRFARPNALLQSAGFCTMGAAIPLAIGMAASNPGAPVVAVLGDGGLEMCLGELGTIRDQNLPIVILVLQDQSLALIELKQNQAGLARAGVQLGATRYEDIAVAFSGTGARVNTRVALDAALHAAFKREGFTLIVCEVEASAYAGCL